MKPRCYALFSSLTSTLYHINTSWIKYHKINTKDISKTIFTQYFTTWNVDSTDAMLLNILSLILMLRKKVQCKITCFRRGDKITFYFLDRHMKSSYNIPLNYFVFRKLNEFSLSLWGKIIGLKYFSAHHFLIFSYFSKNQSKGSNTNYLTL